MADRTTAPSAGKTAEMEKDVVAGILPRRFRTDWKKSGKYRVAMTRKPTTAFIALRRAGCALRAGRGPRCVRLDPCRCARRAAASTMCAAPTVPYNGLGYRLGPSKGRAGWPRRRTKADAIAGPSIFSAEPEEVADILIDLTQRETNKTFPITSAPHRGRRAEEFRQAATSIRSISSAAAQGLEGRRMWPSGAESSLAICRTKTTSS